MLPVFNAVTTAGSKVFSAEKRTDETNASNNANSA